MTMKKGETVQTKDWIGNETCFSIMTLLKCKFWRQMSKKKQKCTGKVEKITENEKKQKGMIFFYKTSPTDLEVI